MEEGVSKDLLAIFPSNLGWRRRAFPHSSSENIFLPFLRPSSLAMKIMSGTSGGGAVSELEEGGRISQKGKGGKGTSRMSELPQKKRQFV